MECPNVRYLCCNTANLRATPSSSSLTFAYLHINLSYPAQSHVLLDNIFTLLASTGATFAKHGGLSWEWEKKRVCELKRFCCWRFSAPIFFFFSYLSQDRCRYRYKTHVLTFSVRESVGYLSVLHLFSSKLHWSEVKGKQIHMYFLNVP